MDKTKTRGKRWYREHADKDNMENNKEICALSKSQSRPDNINQRERENEHHSERENQNDDIRMRSSMEES